MQDSPFDRLKQRSGATWPAITQARLKSSELDQRIDALALPENQNTSLVIFGSAARREFTGGSDIDWSLLVDGPADPAHVVLLHHLKKQLRQIAVEPGGTFGALVSSHELIHHIGGAQDTNLNLTIRMLLMLESRSVNNELVRERVIRGILNRYITSSSSVAWNRRPRQVVPRFLLNDFVRYWRTITVDYAAKRWEQSDKKWGLRNAKLRMSRKLIFVAGLLMCFKFELDHSEEREAILSDMATFPSKYAGFLLRETRKSPIDALSDALLLQDDDLAHSILDPYDEFLAMLANDDQRRELEELRFEDADRSSLFDRVRVLGHQFQSGISELFFHRNYAALISEYGVF